MSLRGFSTKQSELFFLTRNLHIVIAINYWTMNMNTHDCLRGKNSCFYWGGGGGSGRGVRQVHEKILSTFSRKEKKLSGNWKKKGRRLGFVTTKRTNLYQGVHY